MRKKYLYVIFARGDCRHKLAKVKLVQGCSRAGAKPFSGMFIPVLPVLPVYRCTALAAYWYNGASSAHRCTSLQ